MSSSRLSPLRPVGDRADISVQQACLYWFGGWSVAQILGSAVAAVSGHTTLADAGPAWLLAVGVAGWVPLVIAAQLAGIKFGKGSFVADYGLSFKPADLLGIPIGVFTQLVLVRLVYWPLQAIWPHVFTQSKLEQRAHDLYHHASGVGIALLIVAVVVGAPLVEELVYRGLLQGAFTRRLHEPIGVAVVALWFAVVHFQPVETPGLFVVGLVLGTCALFTRRLGLGVVAHMSFNATGLALVAMTGPW